MQEELPSSDIPAPAPAPSPKYVIGIDEVGRGSLAGPVTVAVVCMPANLRIRNPKLGKLRDSKKLTPLQREAWARYFETDPRIWFRLARVYPRMIEKINISNAANLAAYRAFNKLAQERDFKASECKIFLDGGLYLYRKGAVPSAITRPKADEKVRAVAIASILAKVSRDRFMARLARKYPGYGLEAHKGYSTKEHQKAVLAWGPSKVHRLTFLRKYHRIEPNRVINPRYS
jgi:ribonuclease HII